MKSCGWRLQLRYIERRKCVKSVIIGNGRSKPPRFSTLMAVVINVDRACCRRRGGLLIVDILRTRGIA